MWLDSLLSLVFPPSHHQEALRNTTSLTPHPQEVRTLHSHTVLTCAEYADAVKHAILCIKKQKDVHATELLADLLSDVLTEEMAEHTSWNNSPTYIVPMPLSATRERERGFNQVTLVCQRLPHELLALVRTDVLTRHTDTPMQKTLPREERLKNVAHVFACDTKHIPKKTHIFLVDDVITTGATLASATNTLAQKGLTVTPVALARA